MNAPAPPAVFGLPPRARVLAAIRWLFRRDGLSPSHSQIAAVARIAPKHVHRYVDQLAAVGVMTYRRGVPHSIRLVDRGAELSDDELSMAAAGRGATLIWSKLPALAAAFPVTAPEEVVVADWGLKLLAELDDKR